jgi:hypothetical protein
MACTWSFTAVPHLWEDAGLRCEQAEGDLPDALHRSCVLVLVALASAARVFGAPSLSGDTNLL